MNNIEEIVRLTNEANATINQGFAAGLVLGGINALSAIAIVDKLVDPELTVACLAIVIVGQLALAVVTALRLRTIWKRRRKAVEELEKEIKQCRP